MDKFTRIYSIIFAIVIAVVLFNVLYEPADVSKLNARLLRNSEVASYPYHFRVIDLNDGVASMGTPRSAEFSAYRALILLYPELRNQGPDSPAMLDAQQEMARIQGIARSIVVESNDVSRVNWKLDENWIRGKGIDPGSP